MRVHHKWISALLLPCYLGACTSWHRDTQPLPETLAAERTPPLRLTLMNGQRITLRDPRIVGDSIVGTEKLSPQQFRDPRVTDKRPRASIALADVQSVERSTTDPGLTVISLLIMGGVMGVIVAWTAACLDGCSFGLK